MSHKQAKLARKMFPELGSKHRREQERLKSEALAKAVKITAEDQAELIEKRPQRKLSTFEARMLLASLGGLLSR